VIAAVTALIVPTGTAIADSCHHAVMSCSLSHVGCGDIGGIVSGNNGVFTSLVQDLAMAFPLVLGILWGAPLVAGQFEAGTEDFEWTQGVTPRRRRAGHRPRRSRFGDPRARRACARARPRAGGPTVCGQAVLRRGGRVTVTAFS
jgi:hypothetical protein